MQIAATAGLDVDDETRDQGIVRELWEAQSIALKELARSDPPPHASALPPSSVELVGRRDDLSWLDDHLLGSSTELGLVTLDGMPGVGKTELAVSWGWQNRDRFARGVFYLDLRGSSNAGPLLPSAGLARLVAFFLDEKPADTYDQQLDQYRSVTSLGDLCVILDNARDEDHVRDVIPSAGCCIVTSRERLTGLRIKQQANRAPVLPLTSNFGAEILQAHTTLSAEVAEKLSDRCGGLPLGLQLAAELLATSATSPEDLLQSVSPEALAKRLDEATIDSTATLESLFGQSFGALSDSKRQVAQAVALAPCHEVSAELVATVTNRTTLEAHVLLDRLISSSLLSRTNTEHVVMHDLLRSWVHGSVPDQAPAVRRSVYGFYEMAADRMDRRILPSRGRPATAIDVPGMPLPALESYEQAMEWGENELDNVVSVVSAAIEDEAYSTAAALPYIMMSYCNVAKPWPQWIAMSEAVVAVLDRIPSPLEKGHVTNGLGIAYREIGEYETAVDLFGQAERLYGQAGEIAGRAMTLNNLSICCKANGELERAVDFLMQASLILTELHDDFRKGIVVHNLAETLLELGDLDNALAAAIEAYECAEAVSDAGGKATTMTTIAEIRFRLGDAAGAEEAFREARSTQQQLKDIHGLGYTTIRLARLLCHEHQWNEAEKLATEAHDIFTRLDDEPQVVECEGVLRQVRSMSRPTS